MVKKQRKWLSLLIAVIVLCVTYSIPILAAPDSNTIKVNYSVENHTKGIAGSTFSITQVMYMENGSYSPAFDMGSSGLTTEEILKGSSGTIEKISKLGLEPLGTKTTNSNGEISFTDLQDGIYLIKQVKADGDAAKYNTASPCLVAVPEWEKDTLKKEVLVYPKTTEIKKEEKKDSTNVVPTITKAETRSSSNRSNNGSVQSSTTSRKGDVKTGDTSPIMQYVVLAGAAIIILVIFGKQGKRNN